MTRKLLFSVVCLVACSLGCADGSLPELNGMNPYLRRQWEQDLEFGPTFHQQIDELEQIAIHGGRLSAEEQAYRARQLNALILNHESALLRAHAAKALAAIPLAAAADGLRMAMVDSDASVRIAACEAWGKRGGSEAIANLATLTQKDTAIDVRIAAIRALGQRPDPTAVAPLGQSLDDRDPAVQLAAMESLRTVSGRDFGNDVAAWRSFAQGGNPTPYTPSIAERLSRLLN